MSVNSDPKDPKDSKDPKGTFRADISDELVEEALRAVEKRAEESAAERGATEEFVAGVADALVEGGGSNLASEGEAASPNQGASAETGGLDAGEEHRETMDLRGEERGEIIDLDGDDEPAGPPPPEERIAALEEELRQKDDLLQESLLRSRETMERLKEAHDRLTRQAADHDNARKRALREREELQRFAIEKLLKDLIPVLDNFDRALAHAGQAADVESFATGVRMTHKHFIDTLGKFGVSPFNAVGTLFDPRVHEAMEHVESGEHQANVVIAEMVCGYQLHERLIRPALVSVSKGPGPAPTESDPAKDAHAVDDPAKDGLSTDRAAADDVAGEEGRASPPPAAEGGGSEGLGE